MPSEPKRYLAFMLRLWQVGEEGEATWRVSLESPHSGERRAFAGLEELLLFLQRETGTEPASPAPESE